MPDLFAKKPAPAPKEIPAPPVARPQVYEPPAPKPVTDPVASTLAETSPAMPSTPERRPYTPSSMAGSSSSTNSSGGFGGGSAAMKRPVAPVRKPSSSGSSMNIGAMLTGPVGIGVGGVLVLGALIYFLLPILMSGNGADVQRFKTLQAAFNEVTKLRNEENVKPEKYKEAATKLGDISKKVSTELKAIKGKKQPYFTKLKSFCAKLQELAKQDLSKPSTIEADAAKSMQTTAAALGIK